jgi:hypothetical protein
MDRKTALELATQDIEALLKAGDERIFEAARRPDGTIDQMRLVAASMRATVKLAEKYMKEGR